MNQTNRNHILPLLQQIIAVGKGAPGLEEKVKMSELIRAHPQGSARMVDEALIRDSIHSKEGLLRVRKQLEASAMVLKKLTAPPWFSAILLRKVEAFPAGRQALVAYGSTQRLVGLADGVDWESLSAGDEVYLSHELNIILGKAPYGAPSQGETAFFERHLKDGRILCKWRDESMVLVPSADLGSVELKPGDEIRLDRNVFVAYEKIPPDEQSACFLDEIPDLSRDQIGGQDENVERLLSILTANLIDPERATEYGLDGRNSILMSGPPGCGKTLLARIAASELSRLSGDQFRFGIVNASNWESPWVGETQSKIRQTFQALRQASEQGPAILFLDEVESLGRIRGNASGFHSDKFLSTLLAEIDGFDHRGKVVILCATNNTDLLDPALYERISGTEIRMDRPNLSGAKAIFSIHFPESLPYASNGSGSQDVRTEIIETAVSMLYSPNGENDICRLSFRDGNARTVAARELASGRFFEQICRAAKQDALQRERTGGVPGICIADIQEAVSRALDRLRLTLTPRNARAYIHDLPQDLDVVAVETIRPKISKTHEYMTLTVA